MDSFFETPLHHLSQFIGDYSQNVCGSSYNEDEVRSAWKNGRMNEDALHPCYTLDSAWPDAPKDFQAEMNRLVKEAGCWPLGWCDTPASLLEDEKKMADVLDVCQGDVLVGLIQAYPTTDPSYHAHVITQLLYEHHAQLGDKTFDPEALVVAVVDDPRFAEVKAGWEEWKQRNLPPPSYPQFSYNMQYFVRSFSITIGAPSRLH